MHRLQHIITGKELTRALGSKEAQRLGIPQNDEPFDLKERTDQEDQPYVLIATPLISIKRTYNPKYGDDRICVCGHDYHRHFDTYESMQACGCKYCHCCNFVEASKSEPITNENAIGGATIQHPIDQRAVVPPPLTPIQIEVQKLMDSHSWVTNTVVANLLGIDEESAAEDMRVVAEFDAANLVASGKKI